MEKDQKPQPNDDKPGEKKPIPQSGGNVVWYMLGVGVILLLVFSILNTGNGAPVTWSDLLNLIEATGKKGADAYIEITDTSRTDPVRSRLSDLTDIEIGTTFV